MIHDSTYPVPSLEGGRYKPSNAGASPIVNSEESFGNSGRKPVDAPTPASGVDWVMMAQRAYESSETWMQVNLRHTWSRNLAHYRSEHGPDSAFNDPANKHRAKHFWPKTRTLVRNQQASGVAAYFSSADVVVIESENADDPNQVKAAGLMKQLVNYRLTQTVPWYKLVLGAIAEASNLGVVFSHQSWEYRQEKRFDRIEIDQETGTFIDLYKYVTVKDSPKIRLVPAENIRISPAADWLDPIASSPYVIELIPMFLGDVLTRIRSGEDPKTGEPAWHRIEQNILRSAGNRTNIDMTRKARAGQSRLDPKTQQFESVDEFNIVWIHRNIVRHNGLDWLYYTVGTTVLLSDPVPLYEVIPWADGARDYTMGQIEIEPDRVYPSGSVEILSPMQKALNEHNNQRIDNIRQVLNRRYLYRQGTQVDVRSLVRNTPGGLIGISGPGDLSLYVKPLETPDVTSSSYHEQDRINMAMDDLSGSTMGATVNSNRKLQETATGMSLMSDEANKIREMELMTITKTWMEATLKQIVQLEAEYETDVTAITVAAVGAGITELLPEFFEHRFSVSVNVGMGATSPTQRMQRFIGALSTATQLLPEAQMSLKQDETVKEVFGIAGYDNGGRFFDFAMGQQKIKEQQSQPDANTQLAREQMQIKMEIEQGKLELQRMKLELDNAELQRKLRESEAQIGLLKAKTVNEKVTSVFSGSQAAGAVSMNPDVAPVTDTILKSAGFEDSDQAPIVSAPAQPSVGIPPEQRENTSPNSPAKPMSPVEGLNRGIETQEIENQPMR